MTAAQLEKDESYQYWNQCSRSSCLLLHGFTQLQSTTMTPILCWLSPATIYVTEELRKQDKRVAYYCCHPGPESAPLIYIRDLISSLVWQILQWNPCVLKKEFTEIRYQIRLFANEDSEQAIHAMFKVMDMVLTSFHGEDVIYIVIDRLEACEPTELHHLMLVKFVNLVRKAPCIVKVMMVVDSSFWKVAVDSCKNIQEKSNGYLIYKSEWDQPPASI